MFKLFIVSEETHFNFIKSNNFWDVCMIIFSSF